MLSTAIHGTNYYGVDGKMVQATALNSFHFGGLFDVTGISPIQGVGSQTLTKNAWGNPAFWPFAFLDKERATDVSALVALGIFASACYVMARCFDVPVPISAIGAQASIVLFAPALFIVHMPTNFCLTPADAVVYAPFMVALGLLARLEPGSWRAFGWITGGIIGLLFYGLYCDPLWFMVAAISWAVPFAVVTFGAWRRKTIFVRCGALGCCFALFLVTRVVEYLYTISRYTARVQFPEVLDRERAAVYVTAATYSPNMKYVYVVCAVGWLLGLLTSRGRSRLLVVTGAVSVTTYLVYSLVYLLIQGVAWVGPIPIYLEHCLLPLYMASAVAGYWGTLRRLVSLGGFVWVATARWALRLVPNGGPRLASPVIARAWSWPSWLVTIVAGLVVIAIIPARVADYAIKDAKPQANTFYLPWPNEPELGAMLADRVGLKVGAGFRGSVNFLTVDELAGSTMAHLWTRAVPTANEYSQLVTPPALYFLHRLLKKDVRGDLNRFTFLWSQGSYSEAYWKALQLFGVRYSVASWRLPEEFDPGYALVTLPRRPYYRDRPEGLWYVYELPRPNLGDYSPTEVRTGGSGAEIMSMLGKPDFDFTRQVVLSTTLGQPLTPARSVRLVVIRGGLHISAKSDGTSLLVLPQQFSHCLRARDGGVRLMRANLMMTGVMFSGDLDTDILFDYGIFSPGCRWGDLADVKQLQLQIDLRMPHLAGGRVFARWEDVGPRLRTAATAIK